MPDLNTIIIERLKLHIKCNITEENIEKYNVDINGTNPKEMKRQILTYYEKQFKYFAIECNKQLTEALADINNFYSKYSYNIVRFVEEYMTLNNGFKELININIFDVYLFQKDNIYENSKKIHTAFCDMIDNYLYRIHTLLTTNINSNQTELLTEEQEVEIEEYLNIPIFCVMIREQLIQ
jgi:hypothetical protein